MLTKESTLAQDTIIINRGSPMNNVILKYSSDLQYKDIELINNDYYVSGYLIIQIDSNSKYRSSLVNSEEEIPNKYLDPTIYFINSRTWEQPDNILIDSALELMECDSCRMYQLDGVSTFDLVRYGSGIRNNIAKDDLSYFLYYYHYYDPDDIHHWGRINQIIRTDSLSNKIIWTKNNEKINYVIFKVDFHAALLKFKNEQKKFVLPTSALNDFRVVDSNKLLRQGFKKSKTIIIVK
ncbi:MAG: hypothetical protein LWX07_10635 [Bacteroidetes bacterium]|nr:hypothetical protein [Bacteroidota bacterium]